MEKKIRWRKKARKSLFATVEYLEEEWGETVKNSFLKRVQTTIVLLKIFPKMGPPSLKNPDFRKIVVEPHHSIIYQVFEDKIVISEFRDNRTRP